jgi:orotate phosphoribosyltransferase
MTGATNTDEKDLKFIKDAIARHVFVSGKNRYIVGPKGDVTKWLFDFRRILLDKEILQTISILFWNKFTETEYPKLQMGGLETAAIPLVTALALTAPHNRQTSAFYIRKSRKKLGLMNNTEGMVSNDPVVLVDDLINTGGSFLKQIAILEEQKKSVVAVFAILRFRNIEAYDAITKKGIKIITLFSLDELSGLAYHGGIPNSDTATIHSFVEIFRRTSKLFLRTTEVGTGCR